VVMVDDCKALLAHNQSFDTIKSLLVCITPWRELSSCTERGKRSEDSGVVSKLGQVNCDVVDKAQKGSHIFCRLWSGPIQNAVDLGVMSFETTL